MRWAGAANLESSVENILIMGGTQCLSVESGFREKFRRGDIRGEHTVWGASYSLDNSMGNKPGGGTKKATAEAAREGPIVAPTSQPHARPHARPPIGTYLDAPACRAHLVL